MASTRLIFFFCSIFLYLIALTVAQQKTQPLENFCINDQGNFTTNSTYQTNLNHLLSTLTSDTKIDYGFYNSSYGRNSNQVNAMALCRGDVKPDSCRSCINTSALELPKLCPNQKEAVIWYDNCMLRYSDRYIFGNMEFGPSFWMYNENNVSDSNTFNQAVGNLLDNLQNQAASGGPLRKFATGNKTTSKSQTIYALAQCTPDLSKQQCSDCLNNATALLPKCCAGRQGGRVIAPSCNFRYEIGPFYADTAEAPTTSPSPSPSPATSPPPTSQPPASPDESPSPATSPPPTSEPPSSPDESPPPATSPPPTSEPPSSPDESPPPATSPPPTSEPPPSPDESPPPPPLPPTAQPPTNSSNQDGNASHDTSPTFVLVIIPLLLSLYLPSVSAYF